MASARIELDLRERGASLRAISRELRRMDAGHVTALFRGHLERAAAPYPRLVRAAVLAIPVTGPKHTGLRARIALCAAATSWTDARSAGVSVYMDPRRMLPDYLTLPLYMEGVAGTARRSYARWRHPVYGTSSNGTFRGPWVTQPPHPYFYQAVASLGEAAGAELRAALEDISRRISG